MKKHFFSLIELAICFSILAMIGSALSFWVIKKIEKDRFFSNVNKFQETILLCQKMAKIRQSDIVCTLNQVPEGVKYEAKHIFLAKGKNIITHSSMEIDSKNVKIFKIEFSLSGCVYPKASIYFYSKNKKYVKKIDFNS